MYAMAIFSLYVPVTENMHLSLLIIVLKNQSYIIKLCV